jgi:hypothetical protein
MFLNATQHPWATCLFQYECISDGAVFLSKTESLEGAKSGEYSGTLQILPAVVQYFSH